MAARSFNLCSPSEDPYVVFYSPRSTGRCVLGSPPSPPSSLWESNSSNSSDSSDTDSACSSSDGDAYFDGIRKGASVSRVTEQDVWLRCSRELSTHLRSRPTLPASWENGGRSFEDVDV